ncbi:hypothetical protein EON63_20650 [archaeon]|nr:MAG: hypothetical protein EON63_20650 [archaeon]
MRNTNNIADIEGAHADSIRHSMRTTRQTNPLQPVYQALDPGELLLPVVLPLVPPDVIQIPTVPPRLRAKPSSKGGEGVEEGLSKSQSVAGGGHHTSSIHATLGSTWNSTNDLSTHNSNYTCAHGNNAHYHEDDPPLPEPGWLVKRGGSSSW